MLIGFGMTLHLVHWQALMRPSRPMVETSADVARKNAIKDNQRFIDENNVQLVRILPTVVVRGDANCPLMLA